MSSIRGFTMRRRPSGIPQCIAQAVKTPSGTAMSVVSAAAAKEPTIRAPIPKTGGSSVGYHSVEKRKSVRDTWFRTGNACVHRKITMAASASTLTAAATPIVRRKAVSRASFLERAIRKPQGWRVGGEVWGGGPQIVGTKPDF